VQFGPGSPDLLMAYRGDSTATSDDQRLFYTRFNGIQWGGAQLMGDDARSPSAPTVAWAHTEGSGSVWATHQGQTGEIFMATYDVDENVWSSWHGQGGITHSSPQIAVDSADDIVLAHRSDDGRLWYRAAIGGEGFNDWQPDPTGWHTSPGVMAGIVAIGELMFLLITGEDHRVYYRRILTGGISD
jgi:hypothetical protein